MDSFTSAVLNFRVALKDVYRHEDDRELIAFPKRELTSETITEDFTAMFYAMFILYRELTGENANIVDFVGVCNKLAFQYVLEKTESERAEK